MTVDRLSPRDVVVVVPTIGRTSLVELLEALAVGDGELPRRIVLVDDRRDRSNPLLQRDPPSWLAGHLEIVVSGGRGPAAARNVGWRHVRSPWVAFLDDDVLPPPDWLERLCADLAGLPDDVAASQGRIRVPLPADRPPTDWERNVAGLEHARWATADMAYRRVVLAAVGGFDERFRRAYREDADLGLRVTRAGHRIVTGRREMVHPVRPAGATVSLAMQAGNAEDPFMRALHGRQWRRDAGVPPGRRPWHLATVAGAAAVVVAGLAGRRRAAAVAAVAWAALTGDFAWRRIAPGPRTRDEVSRMAATSVVLPFAATWHWLRGLATLRSRLSRSGPRPRPAGGGARRGRPAAVLFDRDGTLVRDVPYNGNPDAVRPVDGARDALARLRAAGVPTAVISNQSGVGRGLVTMDQVEAVNARIEAELGALGPWFVCPHVPDDGCDCRKPSPVPVQKAAAALGVDPADCVVIGDIGSDVDSALAAGARPILVPTPATLDAEVAAAPEVAADLVEAVELALRPEGGR
jgi:histidinol-phosphate phosphatase family protein